jgi:hypothetical protein
VPNGARPDDSAGTGYDKAHAAPDGDLSWSQQVEYESFLMTNMYPQHGSLNRGIWKLLETSVRGWAVQRNQPYTIYVGADVSAVIATITRPAGSLITAQVKVNNSGWRKLSFQSNISNTGALPLPSNVNNISISTAASDQSVRVFTITIYRDTKSAPTGGSTASPAPTVSPTPVAQVVSAVRFYINSADGIGSGLAVVPMTPTFSRDRNTYNL